MRNVLHATRDLDAARTEVERLGGRITQVFTPQVFEASLPDGADASSLTASAPADRGSLDPPGRLAFDA